jgi:hypothetical protein
MPSPISVRRFKGLNNYSSFVNTSLDTAVDLLNVFLSPAGVLSKMRVPVPFIPSFNTFRDQQILFNFGTPGGYNRLVLAGDPKFEQVLDILAGNSLHEYDSIFQPQQGLTLGGTTSIVASNSLAFHANGKAMWKLFPLDQVPDARGGTNPPMQGWGYNAPSFGPTIGSVAAGAGTALAFGWKYGIAFKCAITGHVSNMCDVSLVASVGPQGALPIVTLNFPQQILGKSSIDTYTIYRTYDGGTNYYALADVPSNTTTFVDNSTPDNQLNQGRQAQFINNPPPIGNFLCVHGGRIIIANLLGAPQNFAWSGYEQILDGRPEESFPPYNQGNLQLNNDDLTGVGSTEIGLVFFSSSSKMYLMQGALSDITLSQPVVYTEFLTDLPFNLGCRSHESIQTTARGLIFLGTDNVIHGYSGQVNTEPFDLAVGAAALLADLTPGFDSLIRSAYWNFYDRDWYVISFPYKGSNVNNRVIIVDLSEDEKTNFGAFVSDVQADDVCVVKDANGKSQLCILQDGNVLLLHATEVTISGYPEDRTLWLPSTETMNAYWESGYAGNDDPEIWKTFRYVDVVSDIVFGNGSVPALSYKLVDDDAYTFDTPRIGDCKTGSIRNRHFINYRVRRAGVRIQFDALDYSQNVLQIRLTYNTSKEDK